MKLLNPLLGSKLIKYPEGSITQYYKENPALYKPFGLAFHPGIDIYMPYGTPILAATDGKVVEIRDTPDGYGLHIRIVSPKIDGYYYETIYGHLSEILVSLKQIVKAGDMIGREGNSGFVVSGGVPFWGGSNPDKKGTHLHFGVRIFKDLEPNSGQIVFETGDTYTILDYNNGVWGYINALPMLIEEAIVNQNMFKLIKKTKDSKEVFAVLGNKRWWIADPISFEAGRKSLWSGWEEIEIDDIMKYEYISAIVLLQTDDPLK